MNVAKKWGMAMLALGLSIFMALPAFAGEWIYDGPENWNWWYKEADGTYPKDSWKQIDGEWYHFDESGYIDIGWRNYPRTEMKKVLGSMMEVDIDQWYYMDDSGKMLKNQNYIGGYTDESGLLHFDHVSADASAYERYVGKNNAGIPKPLSENAEYKEDIEKYDMVGTPMEGDGLGGWRYPITDYRKDFFKVVNQKAIQLEGTYQVPLSKELYERDKLFISYNLWQILANNDLSAGYLNFDIKNNVADIEFEGYYYMSQQTDYQE